MSPSTTPTAERPLRSPTPTNDLPQPMKKIPSNRSGKISTTGPASSRTDLSVKSGKHPAVRATMTSPYPNKVFADSASVQQTVRSGTPYSQSNSSRIMTPASWSEHTEVDLVANIGSRERTRQEVLFEIVSSEERLDNPSHPSVVNTADEPQICERAGQDEGDIHRSTSASILYGFYISTTKHTPPRHIVREFQRLRRVLACKTLRVLRKSPDRLSVPCFACCWPIDNPSATIDKARRNSTPRNIRRRR